MFIINSCSSGDFLFLEIIWINASESSCFLISTSFLSKVSLYLYFCTLWTQYSSKIPCLLDSPSKVPLLIGSNITFPVSKYAFFYYLIFFIIDENPAPIFYYYIIYIKYIIYIIFLLNPSVFPETFLLYKFILFITKVTFLCKIFFY